jgi:small GTP-binding protein
VDTAGIRRKGKTKLMAEKLSVVMARRNIRMADVVLVLMDASEGVLGLDATIAGYAHEGGRGVILCVNKWDLIADKKKSDFEQDVRDQLEVSRIRPGGVSSRPRPARRREPHLQIDSRGLRIRQPSASPPAN